MSRQAAFVLTEPSASHAQTKATALEQLAFDSSHDLVTALPLGLSICR
jgi:hypothetical protein